MSDKLPYLSILIPVYRVEAYLRECLDSIRLSASNCWEAILIDDGSPDSCPQICDEYVAKDPRFRVIHQANAGVATARNAGLDMARGTWIWFVDSDDVVDMSHVDDAAEWLKEHPEIDLVMFDLTMFKDEETIPFQHGKFVVTDAHLSKNDFLMKHICYHHQRLWYHRRGWWKCSPSTSAVPQCGMAEKPHPHLLDRHPRLRSTDFGDIDQPTSGTSVQRNTGAGTECFPETDQPPVRFTRGIRLAEDLEFQYKFLTLCQHPVKLDATLYHYRLREGSATQDATYRARAVEDLPIVLGNLASWTKEHNVQPEPWYDYRLMKLLQNLLYSASQVKSLSISAFQKQVKLIISAYRTLGFPFTDGKKIRLAEWNVRAYFLSNRIYQRFKRQQT